jgi:hypothetical protein
MVFDPQAIAWGHRIQESRLPELELLVVAARRRHHHSWPQEWTAGALVYGQRLLSLFGQ